MLQEAAAEEKKSGDAITAIFLVGDLCKHGLAVDLGTPEDETNWGLMKYTMQEVITAIKETFPDTPILPVVGNNDVEYHDQAPSADIKASYYADLWEIWFKNVTAN